MKFDHEKMDVYRVALEFVVVANKIMASITSGNSPISNQLLRATTSIPLNIAEGAGEHSRLEKARSTESLDVLLLNVRPFSMFSTNWRFVTEAGSSKGKNY